VCSDLERASGEAFEFEFAIAVVVVEKEDVVVVDTGAGHKDDAGVGED